MRTYEEIAKDYEQQLLKNREHASLSKYFLAEVLIFLLARYIEAQGAKAVK